MSVRVGINGFGRIGRNVFRAAQGRRRRHRLASPSTTSPIARRSPTCFKYDSVLGPYPGSVEVTESGIAIDGDEIKVLAERDPAALPWGDLGVDVVIESTGFFTKRDDAAKHLAARREEGHHLRARRAGEDMTVVLGVNFDEYDKDAAPHHLERVVHDELPRAVREGRQRHGRHQARPDDDDPRLHR